MGIDAAYEMTGDTGSEDSQLWQRLLKKNYDQTYRSLLLLEGSLAS